MLPLNLSKLPRLVNDTAPDASPKQQQEVANANPQDSDDESGDSIRPHRVVKFGYDLDYDASLCFKLEERLGRQVEETEVQDAYNHFKELKQKPTFRELACYLGGDDWTDEVGGDEEPLDEIPCSPQFLSDFGDFGEFAEFAEYDFEEYSENGSHGGSVLGTPRSDIACGATSTGKSTPLVPMLKLGGLKGKPGAMASFRAAQLSMRTARRQGPGQTMRTSRYFDHSFLKVLLPHMEERRKKAASAAAAVLSSSASASANAAAAASSGATARASAGAMTESVPAEKDAVVEAPSTATTAQAAVAVDTDATKAEDAPPEITPAAVPQQRPALKSCLAPRVSTDDLDQQAAGKRQPRIALFPPKPSASPKKPSGDVTVPRDNKSILQPRLKRELRESAAVPRKSLHAHALGAAWWAEYSVSSSCQVEVVLPETLWTAHSLLGSSSKDNLSGRLSGRQQLAHTNSSSVYIATLDGETPVVIKSVDITQEADRAGVFAEISVLEHLQNWPGCVRLLGSSRQGDQVSLVLQRCDMNLRQWMEKQENRSTKQWAGPAVQMFLATAQLVDQLHQQGVAHCDIKLDNLLMLGDQLLLSDFGSAAMFGNEEQATLTESRGTESYQCPEMCLAKPVDGRAADVWALGCLLYELVTGKVLFGKPAEAMGPMLDPKKWADGLNSALRGALKERGRWVFSNGTQIANLIQRLLVPADRRPTAAQVVKQTTQMLSGLHKSGLPKLRK